MLSPSGKGEALGKELGGIGLTGSNQSNDDLKRLVDATLDRWGRIDALVNSAGHGPRKSLLELADNDWQNGMEVYFLSAVRPTRLVTPVMQRQKSGSIVNISSTAGDRAKPGIPDVVGVPRRARLVCQDLRRRACGGEHPHEQRAAWLRRQFPDEGRDPRDIPMQRYAKVAEVGELVAFLASERASYITGQNSASTAG